MKIRLKCLISGFLLETDHFLAFGLLRAIWFCCTVVAMLVNRKVYIVLIALALVGCQPSVSGGQLPATSTLIPTIEIISTATLSPEQLIAVAQDDSNRGDWQGTILLLDLAIAQDPANTQALLLRGNAYREIGDFDLAISDYDQALSINSELAAVYHNRALTYVELGDSSAALADFARAIEIAPTFGPAYRNRAELQLAAGNTSAAALDLQIYITLIPNAPDRAEVEAKIAELQQLTIANANPDGLLFFDDFLDPESGWYTNGDPTSPGGYSGGGYVLQMKQTNAGVWAMPGRLFDDVLIEVSATKQGGDNDNFFGLMCRITSSSGGADFYIFMISSDGFYGIAKRVDSGPMLMLKPGGGEDAENRMYFSSKILQGEATNKIAAICSGNRLALYVNDEKLMEVEDGDIARGQVGIVAGARDIPGTSIFFDDFSVFTQPAQ